MFSNQHQLLDSLKVSLKIARLQRFRVLLVLTGQANQHQNAIRTLFTSYNPIMHLPDLHSNSDVSDQINSLLGSEHKCVFFDAHGSFDERLFAAAAGTVTSGGLLVLEVPSLAHWSKMQQSNPAKTNDSTNADSAFIQRVTAKIIAGHVNVIPTPPNTSPGRLTANDLADDTAIILAAPPMRTSTDTALAGLASMPSWQAEQDELIEKLVANLETELTTVSVIQGDRGRGKSALVGRALQRLTKNQATKARQICLTANRQSACTVLLKHARQAIAFLPIDKALQTTHDLLVVEEAGSIPIPILEKLLATSNKIIFVTTVQGYEGSGRGFAVRFAKRLDQLEPSWLKLTPVQPVRWAVGDPLEAFINTALLLKVALPAIPEAAELIPASAEVSLVAPMTLASNDELLAEIYGLLLQAHYQTTPADLRNMLDKPKLLVFAQRVGEKLTGAALVALEGDIPSELHTLVAQKQRRLPDQILPQLLAQSAGCEAVLPQSFARIVRIAVHPELHNHGFGTQLYEQMANLLSSTTLNIGASFGADTPSLSFWLKQGLVPIHYGHRANPRSGLRSVCMVNRTNSAIASIVDTACAILNTNTRALHNTETKLDPVVVQLIEATTQSNYVLDNQHTTQLIGDFCRAHRSFIDTVGLMLANPTIAANRLLAIDIQQMISEYAQMPPKARRQREANLRALLLESTEFADQVVKNAARNDNA